MIHVRPPCACCVALAVLLYAPCPVAFAQATAPAAPQVTTAPSSTPATPAPATTSASPTQTGTTPPGASPTTPPGTTPGTTPTTLPNSPSPGAGGAQAGQASQAGSSGGQAGTSTASIFALSDALQRANSSSTDYNTALTESGVALADRTIARAGLLPNVIYHNQFLYTQGTGVHTVTTPGPQTSGVATPRFIANNAVHEYVSQGVVNETVGYAAIANLRRTGAAVALANAKLEVARRGLIATVATNYYTLLSTDKKLAVTQRALDEANGFVKLTQQLEAAGEVARADVIKAQLQQQQRARNRIDAELANEKARLDLGVLLFPDPRTAYTLAESQNVALPALPPFADVQAAAAKNNPDLRAANANLRVAQFDVTAARAAYLPDLALNYTYGIDSPNFAIHAPDGSRNLGYSAFATLDIPVFDWFATNAKVKQSTLRRRQAQVELTVAQRRTIAELEEFYHEAAGALQALQLLEQSVATATESLRLTNLRYRAGEATVLEVVDAQNSLTDAETANADGLVRYRVALANLQTLTGTLPQ